MQNEVLLRDPEVQRNFFLIQNYSKVMRAFSLETDPTGYIWYFTILGIYTICIWILKLQNMELNQ